MEFKLKYNQVDQLEGKFRESFPNGFEEREVVMDTDTYKEIVVSSGGSLFMIFATFSFGEWTIKINELL